MFVLLGARVSRAESKPALMRFHTNSSANRGAKTRPKPCGSTTRQVSTTDRFETNGDQLRWMSSISCQPSGSCTKAMTVVPCSSARLPAPHPPRRLISAQAA